MNIGLPPQPKVSEAPRSYRRPKSWSARWNNFVEAFLRLLLPDRAVRRAWSYRNIILLSPVAAWVLAILALFLFPSPSLAQLGSDAEEAISTGFGDYLGDFADMVALFFTVIRTITFVALISIDFLTNKAGQISLWGSILAGSIFAYALFTAIEQMVFA